MLSLVPINSNVIVLDAAWRAWVWAMARGEACRFRQDYAVQRMDLQEAEDVCRLSAAYSWLSYRRADVFPDGDLARELMVRLSLAIDDMLARRHGGESGPARRERGPRRDERRPRRTGAGRPWR